MFVGILLADSFTYFIENTPQEVYELADFLDFESEKETKEVKEDIFDKIPLELLYIYEASALQAKNVLAIVFQHLHHPEITTPPPELA